MIWGRQLHHSREHNKFQNWNRTACCVDMAFPPFSRPPAGWGQGGKMINIAYLVVWTLVVWTLVVNSSSWPIRLLKLGISLPVIPLAIMQCFTEQEPMLFLRRNQKCATIWALGAFGCTCPGTWRKTVLWAMIEVKSSALKHSM